MSISGQVYIVAELAQRYGVKDVDGKEPGSLAHFSAARPNTHTAVIE